MSLRFSVSVLAMLGLMACGGGGGTLGGGPDLSAGPGSYADLDIEVDRFASYVGNPDSTVFPDASIEFDGVLLMGTDLATAIVDSDGTDPDGYLGQVNLTADLTVATGFGVTGTASNFYNTSIDAGGNPGGTGSVAATQSVWTLSSAARTGADFDLSVSGMVDGRTVTGVIPMTFVNSPAVTGNVDAVVGSTPNGGELTVVGGAPGENAYDAFLGAD